MPLDRVTSSQPGTQLVSENEAGTERSELRFPRHVEGERVARWNGRSLASSLEFHFLVDPREISPDQWERSVTVARLECAISLPLRGRDVSSFYYTFAIVPHESRLRPISIRHVHIWVSRWFRFVRCRSTLFLASVLFFTGLIKMDDVRGSQTIIPNT